MNIASHTALCFCCALAAVAVARGETPSFIVKLWPDQPPGAVADAQYRENAFHPGNAPDRLHYSKVTDPALEVFLPPKEKACGTAVVICPGGAYSGLAYTHEGVLVARWFNELGIAGIVLKYRLPSDAIMQDKSVGPLQDAQEAIRTVRRRAKEWAIDPARIGVMGFSAGGHLAGSTSTLYRERVYEPADATSARPDFSILVYGVISMQPDIGHAMTRGNLLGANPSADLLAKFSAELHVDAQTPPAFLVHSEDDSVPVENSLRYFAAMKKAGVPGELHVFQSGGHGYGLGITPGSPKRWPEALADWLRLRGLL